MCQGEALRQEELDKRAAFNAFVNAGGDPRDYDEKSLAEGTHTSRPKFAARIRSNGRVGSRVTDALSGIYPQSLNLSTYFENLVADLRGDGCLSYVCGHRRHHIPRGEAYGASYWSTYDATLT